MFFLEKTNISAIIYKVLFTEVYMYLNRFLRLLLSLPVFAFSAALSIQSGIGVNAWDTFALGVANVSPFSYGTIVMVTGIVVLVIDIILREPFGIGTIMDIMIIGKLTDLILNLHIIPSFNGIFSVIALIISLFIASIGTYLYMSAGLSVGPRDMLMLALTKRFKNLPVGLIKGIIEAVVFVIGFMLGAPVGIGTIICVFGTGFILEITLRTLHLDVRKVHQENIYETASHLAHAHK